MQAEEIELRDGIRFIISTLWPYDVSQHQGSASTSRLSWVRIVLGVAHPSGKGDSNT